jgi:hypothetical protein
MGNCLSGGGMPNILNAKTQGAYDNNPQGGYGQGNAMQYQQGGVVDSNQLAYEENTVVMMDDSTWQTADMAFDPVQQPLSKEYQ